MKKSLLLLNVIFIFGLLISSYLLYTGVAPILQGKVRVEMQDEDEIEWSFENGTVMASTYVRIINGGNYDITGIHLDITITENSTGHEIADFSTVIERVPAGSEITEPIELGVDIDSLPEGLKNRLVNESTEFIVDGVITAYSVNRLGMIRVLYHNTFPWEPLVKILEIDASRASIDYSDSKLRIMVPYRVSTSSLLSGTVNASVTIYNGTEPLSETVETIPLGEDYNGTAEFAVASKDVYYLMTHSKVLPVIASFSAGGVEFSRDVEYRWGAPFDGLYVSDVSTSLNTAEVHYSFTNNYSRPLDLSVEMTAYDSSGSEVGHFSDHYLVGVGDHVQRTASISLTGYPDYVIVKVTENISGWSYEFRRDV